jgi:ferritin-like metal-binding protein YciE
MKNIFAALRQEDKLVLLELFKEELRDIYGAEKQLTEALPKMKEAASSPDLALAFEDHLHVTEDHIKRLEKVFSILGEKADSKKCKGIAGLIEESEEVIKNTSDGTATRDVGLIISAQKVEHYEIAAYGSLRQLAKSISPEVSALLETTLQEEKETDMLLSNLADMMINADAAKEE